MRLIICKQKTYLQNGTNMDLVNRLKLFMQKNDIAISQFADNCRIPRPTMSQILNGRNKKISDELIAKIHLAYPRLSVLWLMFGEGEMVLNENIKISEALNSSSDSSSPTNQLTDKTFIEEESDSTLNPIKNKQENDGTKNYPDSEAVFSDYFTSNIERANNVEDNSPDESQSVIEFDPISELSPETTDTKPESSDKPDSTDNVTSSTSNPFINNEDEQNISLHTTPGKRITNIVVFYSDNSFQSFSPV